MAKPEERVVSLKIDNSQFQSGIQTSIRSMDNLDAALKRLKKSEDVSKVGDALKTIDDKGGPALDNLEKKMHKLEQSSSALQNMDAKASPALTRVSGKFDMLGTSINNLANIETLVGNPVDRLTAKFNILAGAAAVALGNLATRGIQDALGQY